MFRVPVSKHLDAPVKYENVVGRTLYLLNRPVHIPYLGSITVYASNLKK